MKIHSILSIAFTLLLGVNAGRIKRGDDGATPVVWGYHLNHGISGPDKWGELYPDMCGAEKPRQSPIDVSTKSVVYESFLDDIDVIHNKDEASHSMHMLNNGHTVSIMIDGDVYIQGGGLGTVYSADGFHFHWGANDSIGSEHRVNGKQFPLEMHIVTYDSERYGTLSEAVNGYNSLAVLGILFEVGEENKVLAPLIDKLSEIQDANPEQRVSLPWIDLQMALPEKTNHYYRYDGSLTTPPCSESVIWTLFQHTQTISEEQLQQFRNLKEGSDQDGTVVPLVDNWRPPQKLQNRKVFASFAPEASYSIKDGTQNAGVVVSHSWTLLSVMSMFFFTTILAM